MPTCTPQLCFGNTAPSYNGEPDYASYSLNPLNIELGIFEIKDGFVQWGECRNQYPGTNNPNEPYNEFKAFKVVHAELKLNGKSSFGGKSPSYRFIARDRAEILQDITDAISGNNPEEVEDSIKNEIVDRLQNIVNNNNCQEVCADLVKNYKLNYVDEGNEPPPRPSPFSAPYAEGIALFKAIAGGQVRFSIKERPGVYRTPYFFFRQRYSISVDLTSIDFCKKVDDQFPLDLTTVTLDPKWQKELIQDDPKLTLCDCLQITVFAESIIATQISDENFLEPESAELFASEAVTSNSVTNLVMNGFGPVVNPSSALALMQDLANRANNNQLKYGFLGNVIGFLTKHTTMDGPLVEVGWVIPLTADTNARTVLAALGQPLLRIGLNETRQLVTNPYGYFQTIQNSLIAAGFGPLIPTYDTIDQTVGNGGVPTVEETATNIDLNGTPSAQNPARTDNAGVVNTVGNGNNYQLINYQQFLNNLQSRGSR
jgi:hypothetical protein